jgi:hypothetical protein
MPGEIDPLNAVTSLFPETAKKPVEFSSVVIKIQLHRQLADLAAPPDKTAGAAAVP